MILYTVVICLVLWYVYSAVQKRRGNYKLPPCFPGIMPLVGHAPLLIGDTKHLWRVIRRISTFSVEQGGLAHVRLGPLVFYVITDPDDYMTVSSSCLEKNYFYQKLLGRWVGQGMVTASVPVWKRISKLLMPALNQQIINSYIGVHNNQARSLVNLFDPFVGKEFDPITKIKRTALEAAFLTTLNIEIEEDPQRMERYFKAIEDLTNIIAQRIQRLWMHVDYLYGWSDLKKSEDEALCVVKEYCSSVLNRKRELHKNKMILTNENNNVIKGRYRSFLDILMDLSEAGELTDKEIQEQVNTLMFAGYETSSITLLYCLVLIGSYPEVQEKIYNELQAVFDSSDRDVEKEDLSRLVYLDAVIKEVTRMFPSAPIIVRYLDKDVKLKTCTMKAGHNCAIMLHSLNRDKIWGKDSNEFRPERWFEDTLPANPNSYTGFGAGRRACSGRNYAMMLITITLAHLLRKYKVKADYTKMEMKLEIVLKPVMGHHITIERRY